SVTTGGSSTATGGTVTVTGGTASTNTFTLGNITTSGTSAAGAVSLSAGGVLTAGSVTVAGLNNGNGAAVTLDSGVNSFTLGSLVTRSTTAANISNYNSDTGSGQGGNLLFRQSGAII